MRKKLIGDYGLLETGLALLAFTLLCYLNTKFFYGVYEGWIVTEQAILILVFMNLIGLVIVALPYLTKKAEGISNDDLKVFLDLPDKDSKITFTLVSGFLSDQALASFLVTLLVFTGKQVFDSFGGVIAAFYIAAMFLGAIILGCVSLVRFLTHFTKYHGAYYALVAMLSTGIMFAFFNVGIKMAAS